MQAPVTDSSSHQGSYPALRQNKEPDHTSDLCREHLGWQLGRPVPGTAPRGAYCSWGCPDDHVMVFVLNERSARKKHPRDGSAAVDPARAP